MFEKGQPHPWNKKKVQTPVEAAKSLMATRGYRYDQFCPKLKRQLSNGKNISEADFKEYYEAFAQYIADNGYLALADWVEVHFRDYTIAEHGIQLPSKSKYKTAAFSPSKDVYDLQANKAAQIREEREKQKRRFTQFK